MPTKTGKSRARDALWKSDAPYAFTETVGAMDIARACQFSGAVLV